MTEKYQPQITASVAPPPAASSKRLLPVAGCSGVFYGVARHHDSEYRGAGHLSRSPRDAAEHEVSPGQLHPEPGGVYSDQRLDGRPLRHPAGVCVRNRPLYIGVISLRHIDQHPPAGGLPHPAGLRRGHDGARGPFDPGADICQIRAHSRHELRRHSRAGWPHAGTRRGRPYRRLPSLAIHLLREYTDRHFRLADGLHPSAGLSRRAKPPARYGRAYPLRLRDCPAVIRAGDIWRTYAERARDPGIVDRVARLCSQATGCMRKVPCIRCCS